MTQVTAKKGKDGTPVTVDVDFGDNLAAMVSKFGQDVVFNHARGSITVALQGWIRSQLDAEPPKTADQIIAAAKDWKPGQRKQGKSPQEKAKEQLAKLSPEQRAALLKEYRNAAKAA